MIRLILSRDARAWQELGHAVAFALALWRPDLFGAGVGTTPGND